MFFHVDTFHAASSTHLEEHLPLERVGLMGELDPVVPVSRSIIAFAIAPFPDVVAGNCL